MTLENLRQAVSRRDNAHQMYETANLRAQIYMIKYMLEQQRQIKDLKDVTKQWQDITEQALAKANGKEDNDIQGVH